MKWENVGLINVNVNIWIKRMNMKGGKREDEYSILP